MKHKIGEVIHTVYGTAKILSQTEAIVFKAYGANLWLGKRIKI